MKLIDENGQLIHSTNADDIIQHYGKKGMKWGVRKAVEYAKTLGRATVNANLHPIHYAKASREAAAKSALGQALGSKRSLDYQNKRVAELVNAKASMKDAKRNYKKERKAIDEKYSRREDKIGNMKGSNSKIARLENENAAAHLKERGRLDANYKKNSPKNRYANVKKNGRTKY